VGPWLPVWLPKRKVSPLPGGQRACDLGALGGTRTPNLLIRRSGHIVQDRPLRSVCWADIPQLSARDASCPAAWQQCWQQSRRPGTDPRLSAFQAGHIPSWRGSCERYALLPVAVARRWSLLLLSPLLSAAQDGWHPGALVLVTTCGPSSAHRAGLCPAQTPPPNPAAAEPGDGRVRSRPSSRVHEAGSSTWSGWPAVTDGLDGFRESRILLRRVRGRIPTLPLAYRLPMHHERVTCVARGFKARASFQVRRLAAGSGRWPLRAVREHARNA
jgi:hypothetical protein